MEGGRVEAGETHHGLVIGEVRAEAEYIGELEFAGFALDCVVRLSADHSVRYTGECRSLVGVQLKQPGGVILTGQESRPYTR